MSWIAWILDVLRRSPRWVAVLAFAIWIGVIYWASSQPPPVPHAHSGAARAWLMNLRHAPAFGLYAVLFLWATSRAGGKLAGGASRVWLALLSVLVYGVFDELHQYFTPDRDASATDVLTDLAGGWACAAFLHALESGSPAARRVRLAVIGVLACFAAALVATLVSRTWPEITWL